MEVKSSTHKKMIGPIWPLRHAVCLLTRFCLSLAAVTASAVTIDLVPVGNPDNAGEHAGASVPGVTGCVVTLPLQTGNQFFRLGK
ncbi:MAG: hypothetical protein ABSH15_01640 [Verrucomicrobiota bacterium]